MHQCGLGKNFQKLITGDCQFSGKERKGKNMAAMNKKMGSDLLLVEIKVEEFRRSCKKLCTTQL